MESPDLLPEFRVILERVKPGETALPAKPNYDWLGRRTKLGGLPTWEQHDETPHCPACECLMTFVAQIDSVEHWNPENPHSVNALSPDQKWMFVDVGMIFVFYCFDCMEVEALLQSG